MRMPVIPGFKARSVGGPRDALTFRVRPTPRLRFALWAFGVTLRLVALAGRLFPPGMPEIATFTITVGGPR